MTFNDLDLKTKAKLKKFFYLTEAQLALEENNFDKLFGMWENKSYPLSKNMVQALRILFDYTNIDYMRYMAHIPNYFYCDDEDIESIEIPENIVSIGRIAFYTCPNLVSVSLPKTIVKIGAGAFVKKKATNPNIEIFYDGTKEDWRKVKIDAGEQFYNNVIVNCSDGSYKRFTL